MTVFPKQETHAERNARILRAIKRVTAEICRDPDTARAWIRKLEDRA